VTINDLGLISFLAQGRLTVQTRLDILDVWLGIRPAARVLIRLGDETEIFVENVIMLGLSIFVGRGVAKSPIEQGIFVDKFTTNESNSEKLAIFYISRVEANAKAAKEADELASDELLGRALGYPVCCVSAVLNRGRVPTLTESFFICSSSGTYNPLIWPAAAIHDASLLSHFPCSYSCEDSISIATQRWTGILKFNTDIARKIRVASRAFYWIDSIGKLHLSSSISKIKNAVTVAYPNRILPD
jgi:hypothetical protein